MNKQTPHQLRPKQTEEQRVVRRMMTAIDSCISAAEQARRARAELQRLAKRKLQEGQP